MDRNSQSTDQHVPAAPRSGVRPVAAGAARAPRRQSYAAIATIVTIVLFAGLLFGVVLSVRLRAEAGPGHRLSASGSATATASSATSTATPAMSPLLAGMSVISIAMVSASDGWAIAEPSAGNAVLVHYTGGRWMLSGDTYTGMNLNDLAMDGHDDGWAVGGSTDQTTGVVLHYSAGHWVPVQTPHIPFGGLRVWAFSPSQALVLASLPSERSALLRYDHGTWTVTSSPRAITDISVLSANDIWATCLDGHILHEQSGRWTTYTIGGQASGLWGQGQPLAITMLTDSDGWAAGLINASPQGMNLAHFDGHAWTRVQGPAASSPTELHSIAMVSPTEGWAGGDLLTSTGVGVVLLHYTNGQWETTLAPASGGISRIVMVSATEGWAAVAGGGDAGLLHYQNGQWAPYQPDA